MSLNLETALAQIEAEQAVRRRAHEAEAARVRGARWGGLAEVEPFFELPAGRKLELAQRRVAERNADTDAALKRALIKAAEAGQIDAVQADAAYSAACRGAAGWQDRIRALIGAIQAKAA